MIAVGWSKLDGLYGCLEFSTLESCVLWMTHGVAKAAYVTTLLTDPDSARIRWAQVSYVALEAG